MMYLAGAQDAPQEIEGKQATVELLARTGSAWLHISSSPFPVGHPAHQHGMSAQGGGGTPKADAVGKLSKGGCVKMRTRGGVQNFEDIICTWPLTFSSTASRHAYRIRQRRCNETREDGK